MTGQASGTAAALSVKKNVGVGELDARDVIATLEADGVYLGK